VTRLYYEIIKDIPGSLIELDNTLLQVTGHNMLGLAARTIALPSEVAIQKDIAATSAAVVPVTSGEGVIEGFTGAVAAILHHIGIKVSLTCRSDVAGFGEAFASGADLIFAADDRQFLSFNLRNGFVADNTQATAEGFVQALAAAAEKKSGSLSGREVLVLGLGPVGSHAALELQKKGAHVLVYDTDSAKALRFIETHHGIQAASGISEAMSKIDYVYDATPSAEIIDESMVGTNTIISCPGVPHGLTSKAAGKIGPNLIHDNLALGVATMAVQALFKKG
jgi:pyrrolysine biosynthesis protein PylD